MATNAMQIFVDTIAQFTAEQLAADRGKAFRKIVLYKTVEETSVSMGASCGAYNANKKSYAKLSAENAALIEKIGRLPEKNNGGPKKVAQPEATPAAATVTSLLDLAGFPTLESVQEVAVTEQVDPVAEVVQEVAVEEVQQKPTSGKRNKRGAALTC